MKCAVGAMLFGGTLGVAATAEAGLVVWNCNIGVSKYVNGAYNYGTFVNVETQQFYSDTAAGPVGTAFSNWDLDFQPFTSKMTLVSYDPAQGNVGSTAGPGLAKLALNTVVGSSLTSPLMFTASGSLMSVTGSPNKWYAGDTGYFGFKFKVASGAIRYGWGEIDLNTGSLQEGVITTLVYEDTGASVTVGVVPAPGAFALVGLAGVFAARRRKA